MVIGREQSLSRAIALVQSGISVDVVGGRGSGRSTFLHALRARLSDAEWNVVSIRGVASLRQYPLAALHLAGIDPTGRSPQLLHEAAESLRALVSPGNCAILLDDWDDLDEASWGVVESIRREMGVPVVLSRLLGLRARHTPSGLAASTLEPSYVIDMLPLRFDDMEKALESYLHGSIEASTMSRIFAKSGGNIGLAVSLVDATTREGSLRIDAQTREWVAAGDLWSPGMRAVLEGYLENVDAQARDALEVIGIVGFAGLDTVRKLVDWGTLELLEERGLITYVPSRTQQLVTVVPPLLVELFRHEPLKSRHVRLTELVMDRVGGADSVEPFVADGAVSAFLAPEREALFIRLLHERARARRIVSAAEWQAEPTPAYAERYVGALMQTYTPAIRETVEQVFEDTVMSVGGLSDRAVFAATRAKWLAYVDHDVDGAVALLDQARGLALGPYERILDAATVEILVNTRGIPDGYENLLEVGENLPVDVRNVLWEVQLLLLVSTARFHDATRVYNALIDSGRPLTHAARTYHALALLGSGSHEKSLEMLQQSFAEAHGYLDIEGVRIYGAAAAICHIHSGDYSRMEDLFETIFATGDPTPFPAGVQLGILSVASLVEARRGHIASAERLAAEVDRLTAPDGPLPGQARAWAHVQLLAFNNNLADAATLMWDSSMALWSRGALYAGALGLLNSIEIDPLPERLERLQELFTDIPEATTLQAHASYLVALAAMDPDGVLHAGNRLELYGRIGLALAAYKDAADLAAALGQLFLRDEALQCEIAVRQAHPGGGVRRRALQGIRSGALRPRARGRTDGRSGPLQPGDRHPARAERENGRESPPPDPSQAGHHEQARARVAARETAALGRGRRQPRRKAVALAPESRSGVQGHRPRPGSRAGSAGDAIPDSRAPGRMLAQAQVIRLLGRNAAR